MFIMATFSFVSLLDFDAHVQLGRQWLYSCVKRDSGPQRTAFHHVFRDQVIWILEEWILEDWGFCILAKWWTLEDIQGGLFCQR